VNNQAVRPKFVLTAQLASLHFKDKNDDERPVTVTGYQPRPTLTERGSQRGKNVSQFETAFEPALLPFDFRAHACRPKAQAQGQRPP